MINIIVNPSHWVTSVNIKVDRATKDPLTVDLSRALRHHFACAPARKYVDHHQMVPRFLVGWLRHEAAAPLEEYNQECFPEVWKRGRGLRGNTRTAQSIGTTIFRKAPPRISHKY